MKLAKKVLAVAMAMLMLTATFALSASATDSDYTLKFDEDGKFKIMMFADSQDNEELEETTVQLMKEALATYEPDLVIYMGDNTVASGELQADAIAAVVATPATGVVPSMKKILIVSGLYAASATFAIIPFDGFNLYNAIDPSPP